MAKKQMIYGTGDNRWQELEFKACCFKIGIKSTLWEPVEETIMLSEVSQKETDKYHIVSLICGIKNMTQMNQSTEQKQSHKLGE